MKRGQMHQSIPHNLELLNASHFACRLIRAFLRNSHFVQPVFDQLDISPQSLPFIALALALPLFLPLVHLHSCKLLTLLLSRPLSLKAATLFVSLPLYIHPISSQTSPTRIKFFGCFSTHSQTTSFFTIPHQLP